MNKKSAKYVLQSSNSSTGGGEGGGEDLYLKGSLGHTARPLSQSQNRTEGKEETDRTYRRLQVGWGLEALW